jgi:DNA-binding CsgD family transcriptional regulator
MGNFGGSLNLTPRQTQILRLISRGVTDREA